MFLTWRKTTMADMSSKEKYIWSSREIEILIALWENEEVLYNTQCIDYFKRDKRIEALDRLSDTLKISIPEIRKKMTNLRTYYAKELWKVKKAEAHSDPNKIYISRWIFFEPLDFLRDNCNPKHKGDDNEGIQVYTNDEEANDSTNQWDDSNLLDSLATAVNGDKEDSKENIGDELVEDSLSNDQTELSGTSPVSMVQINTHESPKVPDRNSRKRTGDELESVIAKLRRSKPEVKVTQPKSVPAGPRIDLTSSNPDMVFAHHVGLTLMNIKDSKLKDLAKLKIQQVLFETQYGHGTMQSVEVQAYPMTS